MGIGFGVLIFSNLLSYLLYYFPIHTNSIFVGLILGCIPTLIKDVNSKKSFKLHYIIYTLIALFIGFLSVYLEKTLCIANNIDSNFFYLIFCGFAMSIGIVVPGVSSTIILMLLGSYNIYLSSISNINLNVLIPMGIGILIGSLIFMKITKFLLNNFYAQTFFAIIGFTLGSILVILPNISFNIFGIISILCICLGFFISNTISNR